MQYKQVSRVLPRRSRTRWGHLSITCTLHCRRSCGRSAWSCDAKVYAAEEQGPEGAPHNYETIAEWIRRIGDHAEAVSDVLVHDLELSEVVVDEFWSFVGKKGATPYQRGKSIPQRTSPGNGGDA